MHLTRPDGLANAIGDGDDGRLFWLTERAPLDFRGLLAVGAVVFDRGDFRYVAGVAAGPASPPVPDPLDPLDDVAWTLGLAGVDAFDRLPAQGPGVDHGRVHRRWRLRREDRLDRHRDTRRDRRGPPGDGT